MLFLVGKDIPNLLGAMYKFSSVRLGPNLECGQRLAKNLYLRLTAEKKACVCSFQRLTRNPKTETQNEVIEIQIIEMQF